MRRLGSWVALGTVVLASLSSCSGDDPANLSTNSFSWTESERKVGFANWDQVFPGREIPRGDHVYELPTGVSLTRSAGQDFANQLDSFMSEEKVAGIIVLQDGIIRLESYGLDHTEAGRWTSQSMAKSVTSTLVGVAVKDGFIRSIDDPVSRYIPELRGSAYDQVSIRHLMTMTSGVRWNENYSSIDSDLGRFYSSPVQPGVNATVSYMRALPAESTPGTRWVYNTGETHLLGELVSAATRQNISHYLSTKIWAAYGMEQSATWSLDRSDHELAGCCLQASLRDYARFGNFVLDGGRINGTSIVPHGWFDDATRAQIRIGAPGRGYGYQWWTNDSGAFQAIGIYGQLLYIDPARRMVVVINSAWREAVSQSRGRAQGSFVTTIADALDQEANR